MTCEEVLEKLAAGETPAHAEECASCREAALRYRSLQARIQDSRQPPPPRLKDAVLALAAPRRIWPRVAAAAAILLVVGVLVHQRRPAPSDQPPAPAVPSYPRDLGAPDRIAVLSLGPASHVEADAGALVHVESSERLVLRKGRIYVRASSPLVLRTPRAECAATDAAFELRVGGAAPASFVESLIGTAWAEAPLPEEITVASGTVEVRIAGRSVFLKTGQRLRLEAEPVVEAIDPVAIRLRLAWRDGKAPSQDLLAIPLGEWTASGRGKARLENGKLTLEAPGAAKQRLVRKAPLPERFTWSATLRRLKGGYVEVFLPSSIEGDPVTLGELAPLGDGQEHLLTLRWDLDPVLLLDGVVLRRFPRGARLEGLVGLGVVDGSMEVSRWTFQELP